MKKKLFVPILILLMLITAIPVMAATHTYSVTYYKNGGKNAPAKKMVKSSKATVAIKLSDKKPTRKGYVFLSWNSKKNGKGKNYAPGAIAKLTKKSRGLKLYARWKKGYGFVIKYDANGGTDTPPETIVAAAKRTAKVKVTKEVPKKKGFVFAGWNTKKNGKGKTRTSGEGLWFNKPKTVTLYAIWKKPKTYTYKISFDGEGGEGIPDTIVKKSNAPSAEITLPDQIPTLQGYTFVGWNATKGNGGITRKAGSSFTLKAKYSPVTLYARWKKNAAEKTTEEQEASSSGSESDIPEGQTLQGGTEAEPSAGDETVTPGGQTPTATYTYKLVFSPEGGSAAPATLTAVSERTSYTFTIPSEIPVRSGYTFGGWCTDRNGNGSVLFAGGKITAQFHAPAKTLYATWDRNDSAGTTTPQPSNPIIEPVTGGTPRTFYLKMKCANSVYVEELDQSMTSTESSVTFTVPYYALYENQETFSGWNTKEDGTGTTYHAGDQITLTYPRTTVWLYARRDKVITRRYEKKHMYVISMLPSDSTTGLQTNCMYYFDKSDADAAASGENPSSIGWCEINGQRYLVANGNSRLSQMIGFKMRSDSVWSYVTHVDSAVLREEYCNIFGRDMRLVEAGNYTKQIELNVLNFAKKYGKDTLRTFTTATAWVDYYLANDNYWTQEKDKAYRAWAKQVDATFKIDGLYNGWDSMVYGHEHFVHNPLADYAYMNPVQYANINIDFSQGCRFVCGSVDVWARVE